MNAFKFQAMTERKFEELNSFKATAEEELHSLRTELRDVREVTEQQMAELTREFQNFKQNVERQFDELKELIRGKMEQREEQEEAAEEHQELRSIDDIQAASTGHKRPIFKKIRGIFRSNKKKKGFYEPSTQEESSLRNGDQTASRVPDKSRLQRLPALQKEGFVSSPSTQSPSTLSINSTDVIEGLDSPVGQITYEYSRRRTNSSKENGKDFDDDVVHGFNGNTTAGDAGTSYASRCSSGRSKVNYGEDLEDLPMNRQATMTEDVRTSCVRRRSGENSRRRFDAEESRPGKHDVSRHDSTRSQISFDIEEDRTDRRYVRRNESTRSQISFDIEEDRTDRRDVRRHDSTRSQISFDAKDARAGRRDVKRNDSTKSQISVEITTFSPHRTYSNQSLPVISCRFYQEEIEDPDEIEGCSKKTRSLQEIEYISNVDSYDPWLAESIIMEHPSDKAQKEGLRVEFKCLGQENRNVTYQWYKDRIPLRGKQSSLLVLDPVKLIDFGYYVCQVRSLDGREDSRPAALDVIPRDGMRLQLLNEVFEHFLETRETVEKLLMTEVTGLGGWKQVAHKYKMREVDIGVLKGRQDAGATVIAYIRAHNPELTVYDFCKTLKGPNIRRLDIVGKLRGHLSVPKE